MIPPTPDIADRAFVHSRLIDAPRARVFRAFSEAAHLARWWGPAGFSNSFEHFDPRTGGRWRFVMHGPDGTDYPNESVFVEVAAPERVVIEHVLGHHFFLTITFTPQGDKTLVGWQQVFDTAAERARIAPLVLEANEQNLDRLAAEVRQVEELPPLPDTPPGRYRHHKGGEYEVIGAARHSETLDPLVVYRPLHGASGLWVRPHAMFFGVVEVDGALQPRFAFVSGD